MAISETISSQPQKWSRLGQLARGAAIAQCNRERGAKKRVCVRWTAKEMKIVLENYPDYERLLVLLPHRTLSQIKQFAQCYGIAKKRHVWTTPEITLLKKAGREGWPNERLCAAFPHLRPKQIYAQLLRYGFKRQHGPKLFGVPVLDHIRARAHAMNLSMIDLDAISGGGKYWQKSTRRLDWRRINIVLCYMGGHLEVAFPKREEAV